MLFFKLIFLILSYSTLLRAHESKLPLQIKDYLDLLTQGPEASLETVICPPLNSQKIDRTLSKSIIKDKHNQEIEISSISYDYLLEVFKDVSKLNYIPYDYPQEGCYARAHEMVKFLESKNILAGKVFLEGDLKIETKEDKKGFVKWWFHVAPIVMVREKNKEELYVLDPSIFDHPVKVQEWREAQIKHQNMSHKFPKRALKEFFTTRFQYLPNELDEDKKNYDPYFFKRSQESVVEYSLKKIENRDEE